MTEEILMAYEYNCATGEETSRPLNADELAFRDSEIKRLAAEQTAQEVAAKAEADAKDSAKAKLSKLGLTEDEIKAIIK